MKYLNMNDDSDSVIRVENVLAVQVPSYARLKVMYGDGQSVTLDYDNNADMDEDKEKILAALGVQNEES